MRKALWMAVLVTASGLLSTTASAQQAKAFTGMRLFNSYCYLCHGTQGKGDGPLAGRLETKPKSLASNEVERLSDREIFRVIQGTAPHGKADQMPEFGRAIPEPDIDALLTYVRFIQKAEHPLMGNPELGKAVYDRYCVVCHGENGRGSRTWGRALSPTGRRSIPRAHRRRSGPPFPSSRSRFPAHSA